MAVGCASNSTSKRLESDNRMSGAGTNIASPIVAAVSLSHISMYPLASCNLDWNSTGRRLLVAVGSSLMISNTVEQRTVPTSLHCGVVLKESNACRAFSRTIPSKMRTV